MDSDRVPFGHSRRRVSPPLLNTPHDVEELTATTRYSSGPIIVEEPIKWLSLKGMILPALSTTDQPVRSMSL